MASGSIFGSYAHMAWQITRHFAALPFRDHEADGLNRMHRLYADDRVPHLTPNEHASLAEYSGCIGCGLCGAWGEAELEPADPRVYDHPMSRPLALSRDLSTAWTGREHLATAPPIPAENVCPMGVPLDDLTEFLTTINQRLDDVEERA